MQNQGWKKGCIPKSPDSYIETLVQMVDRGRFHFELGDLSNGPRLMDSQNRNSNSNLNQPDQGNEIRRIGPNNRYLGTFELLTLGPGLPPPLTVQVPSSQHSVLWCNEVCEGITGLKTPKSSSKKRLWKEIGKIGRNITHRLLCAVFDKDDGLEESMDIDMHSRH